MASECSEAKWSRTPPNLMGKAALQRDQDVREPPTSSDEESKMTASKSMVTEDKTSGGVLRRAHSNLGRPKHERRREH